MVRHRDMAASARRAHVARNPLTAMEYLDRLAGDANVNFLFDNTYYKLCKTIFAVPS